MRQGKGIQILLSVGLLLMGCARLVASPPDSVAVDSVADNPAAVDPVAVNPIATVEEAASVPAELSLETHETETATVFVVTVPTSYTVQVAASETLKTVEDFAEETGAAVVLNAGFFDPANGQTTSHIVVDRAIFADPADNLRLVENPDLAEYLEQILNRSEFRRYNCNGAQRYDIVAHSVSVPEGCALISAVGAGPQLLPEDTALAEAFIDIDEVGQLVRDAIGRQQRNARSAVGLRSDGAVMLFVVAQRQPSGRGMTLVELADFMRSQGVETGLNLDGGSSSSLVFGREVIFGRLTAEGQPVIRPVKSVLIVKPQS